MNSRIALTSSMRSNLLSLKKTEKQIGNVQNKLSTGYRVNSAMDNPSSYFTAQSLNYRADDLANLLNSIGQAVSTLETTDTGLTTLQELVEQAESVAKTARDTPNIPSELKSSKVTFNSETEKTDKITDVLNIEPRQSLTMRLGNANQMTGTANVNSDLTLKELDIKTGSSVDFIVGENTHSFMFTETPIEDVVKNADGDIVYNVCIDETLGSFMKTVEYAIGRNKISSEFTDSGLTFKTLDNSALMIRSSTLKIAAGSTKCVTATDLDNLYFSQEDYLKLTTDGQLQAQAVLEIDGLSVSIPHEANAAEIASIVNSNEDMQNAGYFAESNALGDLIIFNETDASAAVDISFAPEDKTKITASVDGTYYVSEGKPFICVMDENKNYQTVGPTGDITSTTEPTIFLKTHSKTTIQNRAFGQENGFLPKREGQMRSFIEGTSFHADITSQLKDLFEGKISSFVIDQDGIKATYFLATHESSSIEPEDRLVVHLDQSYTFTTTTKDTDGNEHFALYYTADDLTNGVSPTVTEIEQTGLNTFNSAIGFDSGTEITIDSDMTVEEFRNAFEANEAITTQIDQDGLFSVSGKNGDDIVLADKDNGNITQVIFGQNNISATNGVNERLEYASQFDDLLNQIDTASLDSSYKGINLLNGDDLTVTFNETRTSSLELKGVTFNSTGLGLTVSKNDWIQNEQIDLSIEELKSASSQLRLQANIFGQNLSTILIRKDFTEDLINKLNTGSDKLTLADTNEEAANMLSLQTRQSLASNSLSMANQAAQNVLKIF